MAARQGYSHYDAKRTAKRALPRMSESCGRVCAGAAVLAAGGWFYRAARSALPQLDGQIAIVPGLTAPVTVIRDGLGVPHLQANQLDDLFMAQGYVTAQDRLWQLDMIRRYAAGELSEVVGTVRSCTRPHATDSRAHAHRGTRRGTPVRQQHRHLDAYVRGVNASMDDSASICRLEFRIMRYQPGPGRREDTLLVVGYMCQMLNHYNFETELAREKVLAQLGPQLTAELYPSSSADDAPPQPVSAPGRGRRPPPPVGGLAGTASPWGRVAPGRELGSGIQQLGRLGRPHSLRQASSLQRHAPRSPGAESLV